MFLSLNFFLLKLNLRLVEALPVMVYFYTQQTPRERIWPRLDQDFMELLGKYFQY